MNMEKTNINSIMSFFIENSAPNLPPEALAEVFDKLIWCLSDNGEGILEVRKEWIAGDDLFKVEVALAMTETFPYETREEMVIRFDEIVNKWPDLESRCSEILSEWDQQM